MQGGHDTDGAHQDGGLDGPAVDCDRDERQDRPADDKRQERDRPRPTRRRRIGRQHDERTDRRRNRDWSDDGDGDPEHRQDRETEHTRPEVEALAVDRHQFPDEGGHRGPAWVAGWLEPEL